MRKILNYILLGAAIALLVFIFIGASYADNGKACMSCHEMKVPVEKWTNSAHEGIECMVCHAEPGWKGLVAAKSTGLGEVTKHLLAEVLAEPIDPAAIHAQVSTDKCLGCHVVAELKPFNKAVDHQLHLDANFDCFDCHRRTAHGNYEERQVRKDKERCLKCHDSEV
ncbi:NapC/NirT family cytochrome c [Metallumcola ferriviriculae]|uniref:NapC/NirT family cytochrome c n=1 Tax=Metallumcola ferriviriculae TaxID=3039180 RepID=A0AAU0UKU6_9FIRM|nr:NapC/NirT family cytochrome c [Desulfitibacteraceae bacterium MK1]